MAYNLLPGNHMKLMIIAKARMTDGFCYIGWDEDRHKLIRPVLRQNSCRWLARDKDLKIGENHLFEVRSPELQGISHPHRANDVFVSYREPCDQSTKAVHDSSDVVDLYDILIKLSRQTVKEVFDNPKQFKGEYVLEHTKCPSVGVYKCKREKFRITTDNNRRERRCEITEDPLVVYNYKITAVDEELPDVDPSEDVLVILGLTRPYRGSSHQFTKFRCYVIVVGFVTRSTSQQQSPQSPLSVLHGENANDVSVSGVLSPQRKRKLETDYDYENKFSSRRFKT